MFKTTTKLATKSGWDMTINRQILIVVLLSLVGPADYYPLGTRTTCK